MPEIKKDEPKNLEAEMNVLGCAFLSSYALEKVCEELSSDMFYDKKNATIFEAMKDIHARKEPMDAIILKNEIEKVTPINSIGGVEFLSEVIDSVVSASNVDTYINIVREKKLRRSLIHVCENIENTARDEINDTNSIIEKAEKEI